MVAEQKVISGGNVNKLDDIDAALKRMREQRKKQKQEKRLREILQKGKQLHQGVDTGVYNMDLTDQIWNLVGLVLQDAQGMVGKLNVDDGVTKAGEVCGDNLKPYEFMLLNLGKPCDWPWIAATQNIRLLDNPDWAQGMDNKVGMIPISCMHYMCMVSVNDILMEAIINTGGARYLVDIRIARKLGLPVQLVEKHRNFRSFQGPNAKPVWYTGIVHRLVQLQFREGLRCELPEIKVIQYDDPLMLLGANFMDGTATILSFTVSDIMSRNKG